MLSRSLPWRRASPCSPRRFIGVPAPMASHAASLCPGPGFAPTSATGAAGAVSTQAVDQRRFATGMIGGGLQGLHSRIEVDGVSPEEELDFRELFRTSVQRRTVGNSSVRRFIRSCDESTYARATAALEGALEGGLKIDSETYDTYLQLLLRSGQIREALATYNKMLERKVTPHTKTFNALIDLCGEKKLPDSAETIFNEMVKRGRQPDVESYEALMRAYAQEVPPRWEKAVAIFDKLQRNSKTMSANTYNSLMVVYMNMTPFDWRVVYNCYYEMRYHKPKILFGWSSYELVDQAMVKGKAGAWRRLVTYIDAWIQLTVLWSFDFWYGIMVACAIFGIVRFMIGHTLHTAGASVIRQQNKKRPNERNVPAPGINN